MRVASGTGRASPPAILRSTGATVHELVRSAILRANPRGLGLDQQTNSKILVFLMVPGCVGQVSLRRR
jgi:hypothetical protein